MARVLGIGGAFFKSRDPGALTDPSEDVRPPAFGGRSPLARFATAAYGDMQAGGCDARP